MSYEFLQDKRFLQQLDSLRIKQQFVRITVLNWKEQPLQQIQGIAISGSVNLDGSSSMRRTASLSMFAEEKENNLANIDHLFAINKKCILELGIVNKVSNYIYSEFDENNIVKYTTINYQERYGNIIWFPLGVYVMFNPSIAHSNEGVTISMQLKDKMCLLNGDLGGEIHSANEFSYQDQQVDINSVSVNKKQVLIYNIIKELVNHWGNEDLNKIIISEVPLQIKQVVKWIGSDPVYFVELKDQKDGYMLYGTKEKAEEAGTIIGEPYTTGQDIGFIYTDFTYPGQLCCNAGDTVTSVLDKLIGVMGNYEYFYDVYGNFRFQEKQNYLNMTNTAYWTKQQVEKEKIVSLPTQAYETNSYRLSKVVYDFTNNQFTTAYNNSLNYNNVKNDFVVWGSYPTTNNSNNRIPCRFHLAIDKKPELQTHSPIELYKDDNGTIRGRMHSNSGVILGKTKQVIVNYDENDNPTGDLYILYLTKQLGIVGKATVGNCIVGKESFSLVEIMNEYNKALDNDIFGPESEWWQHYDHLPSNVLIQTLQNGKNCYYIPQFSYLNKIKRTQELIKVNVILNDKNQIKSFSYTPWYYNGQNINNSQQEYIELNTSIESNIILKIPTSVDWREEIYYQMLEDEKNGTGQNTELNNTYFQYYAQLKEEFPKIFNLQKQEYIVDNIGQHPNEIPYFLDFIDENSELGQYSVSNIGRRAKIIDGNNQKINCVFEPYINDIVFIDTSQYTNQEELDELRARIIKYGQKYAQIPHDIATNFATGGVYNSCFEKIKELLYQYTHVNNTISITSLPIYYLEPNTRITVEDKPAGIYGDYIIQSISLPLDISSTMTINAYKAEQKI